ncbi:hypothetical protein ACQEU3_43305 [Spirillospora sp. CA-253888]
MDGVNAWPPGAGAPVTELDLRGATLERALKLADDLLVASAVPGGRLLVTDDVERLVPHAEVFARLRRSPPAGRLLCVAVGRPAGGASGLDLPGSLLAGQDAGVLWVPDPGGHDWSATAAAAVVRRAEPEAGPEAGLNRLRELLTVPEVFDQAGEAAAAVPGGVSNPGLWLSGTSVDGTEFPAALLAAVAALLEPGSVSAPALTWRNGAQEPQRGDAATVRLTEGGPLYQADERAGRAVEQAGRWAARLGGPATLFGSAGRSATRAAVDAGEALADLREQWRRLFAEVPADTVPSPHQGRIIRRRGVALTAPEAPPSHRAGPSLDSYVADGLAHGATLGALAEGLTEAERRLVRPGPSPAAELDRACPPDLPDLLRDSPPPPPQPWLPVVGLLAAGLAAAGPLGLVAGTALAALWTSLVALVTLRTPGSRAPVLGSAARWSGRWGGVVGAGVAGAAGVGVGSRASSGVWVWALPVALGIVGVAAVGAWRLRCRRWVARSGMGDAPGALAEMRETAARLAAGWTRSAEAGSAVADLVRARAALDGVHEALHLRTVAMRASGGGRGAHGAAAGTAVRDHLADLVREALRPCWRDLATGPPAEHRRRAQDATADLLAEWEAHVARHGPLEPPRFAGGRDVTPMGLEHAVAVRSDVSRSADDVMWQLLGSADPPLLRAGVGGPAAVRFAPRAARAALPEGWPAGTLWVRSARHAGVLRLVPVRPELVRQRWSAASDTEEGS